MKLSKKIITEINKEKKNLFREAFTHKSYSFEKHLDYSYQRLEFFGDAIINLAISEFLFVNYPKMNEGEMTNVRSKVICEEMLSRLSLSLGIDKHIHLGIGEEKDKGRQKDSILADVFESFLGALYFQKGYKFIYKFLEKTFANLIDNKKVDEIVNYKAELQEILQKNMINPQITYEVVSDNKKNFKKVILLINEKLISKGIGVTKKKAEQNAAKFALRKITFSKKHLFKKK